MDKTEREKYIETWNKRVITLTDLGWNLPEKADRKEIISLQGQLMTLVVKASLQQEVKKP